MIPFGGVVLASSVTARRKCRSPIGISRSRHSSLVDREPFRVGVGIWRAPGNKDEADIGVPESTPRVTAPLPIPIADQSVRRGHGPGSVRTNLLHEHGFGMRRGAEDPSGDVLLAVDGIHVKPRLDHLNQLNIVLKEVEVAGR